MTGVVYLVTDDKEVEFVAMDAQPYDVESDLQRLLARDARLLGGAASGGLAGRRWLLIQREAALLLPGGRTWYVDHLFIDDEGVLTIVEVKRSSNPELRREVVGQILDYMAHVSTKTTSEHVRRWLEGRFAGRDLDEVLASQLGVESAETYWEAVKDNLALGLIRAYFVSDAIPEELRHIVDYLNRLVGEVRFIAVEVPRFRSTDGTMTTLVPQVVAGSLEPPVEKGVGLTPTQLLHLEFWNQFQVFAESRALPVRLPKAAPTSVRYLAINESVRLAPYNLAVKDSSGVEIQLVGPQADAIYRSMERSSGEFEGRLGALGDVKWHADKKKVIVTHDRAPLSSREDWPALNEWLARALEESVAILRAVVDGADS